MTPIRLTNPNSYVQVALLSFGTYEAAAKATGTSPSTVRQWRAVDRVPGKHLGTLAQHAGMNPFDLLQYCKQKSLKAAKVKPTTVIDALINGQPHKHLDAARRKQLKTLWGTRLQTLKEVFEDLTKPCETRAKYKEAAEHAAHELGVSVPQIYRLMRTFSVKRPKFLVTEQREELSKEVKERLEGFASTALDVIKGQLPVTKAAKALEISERQVFRYVSAALSPYQGLNLTLLTRYPKYFRLAVAYEIAHEDRILPSLRIKAIYDEWVGKNVRERQIPPKPLKRAGYKEKLIAVLTSEITLNELSILADTPIHNIEEAFDRYCSPLGMSWQTLRGLSIYHQAFYAEILKNARV